MAKFRKSNLDLQAGQKILFNNDTANRIQYNSSTSDLEISGSTVSLIHDGNKAFGTISNGIQVFSPADPTHYLHISLSNPNITFVNDTPGGNIFINGELTGGGNSAIFSGDPDSITTP